MARNPNYQLTFTVLDHSSELANFSLNTAASVDVGTPPAGIATFLTALVDVIDGTVIRYNFNGMRKLSEGSVADAGQREDRWLLIYHDNTTLALYKIELPTRKAGLQPEPKTDYVNLEDDPWADFKTAFEALARSPDGNAVTLDNVELIGRNV